MSSQQTGLGYLFTYSGILKLIEECINVAIISLLSYVGYVYQGYFLCAICVIALSSSLFFSILHSSGFIKRSKQPWHWVECIYLFIIAFLVGIGASAALYVFTRGYITLAIISYCLTAVYFLDALDKYQIATAPQPKYAWTVPNMPDLS